MTESGLKKVVFVINPISGKGKQGGIETLIDRHLDKRFFEYQVRYTNGPGDATGIARQAAADGYNVVVAVGGDGTVNEVTAGLVGSDTALGIIPAGSGNGLSRHLKIPLNGARAIEVINRMNVVKIDTATIDEHVFVNLAGIGFDATIAKKFGDAGTRGFATYFKVTTCSYFRYKPKKYILTIDGKRIERRALMVSFANSSQFGNNASIDPGASVSDGYIDVCILRKIPFFKVPFLAPLLFLKKFDRTRYVEIIRAREVVLKQKRKRVMHVDGDTHKAGKEVIMKILPLSLNVVVP